MFELGIIKNSNTGSIIDKFRDRIMFPIYDELNNLIGFEEELLKTKKGFLNILIHPTVCYILKVKFFTV